MDEEIETEDASAGGSDSCSHTSSRSEIDLNRKFEQFWRQSQHRRPKKKLLMGGVKSAGENDDGDSPDSLQQLPPLDPPTLHNLNSRPSI